MLLHMAVERDIMGESTAEGTEAKAERKTWEPDEEPNNRPEWLT